MPERAQSQRGGAAGLAGRLAEVAVPECARRPEPLVRAWPQYFYRCLGGLALVFFGLQVVSGLALLFFYSPEPAGAAAGLAAAEQANRLAWLLRRLHAAGGQVMVALVLGHLARVLWLGAFQPPRQWHWFSGMGLLVLALAQAFTGALLPAGGPAWSAAAALGLAPAAPTNLAVVLGLHVAAPWAMTWLMRRHLDLVRRTGVVGPL